MAISTSRTSGFVLAKISGVASLKIGILKKRKEVRILRATIVPKLIIEPFSVSTSLIPIENPIPKIGPINGDISMAPITTAVELIFKPIDAIRIENTNIQAVCPLMEIPSLMVLAVASLSVSVLMLKSFGKYSFKL